MPLPNDHPVDSGGGGGCCWAASFHTFASLTHAFSLSSKLLDSRKICRYTRFMAQAVGNNAEKKLIRIDISSDTVCPWCFVGKRNLDKAVDSTKDQYNFEIRWHPYFLNPSAPKEGIGKQEYYEDKFGLQKERIFSRMTEIFRSLGLEYDTSGLTGNTMDSHRLIYFAGQQGLDKQHSLVEELFLGYFVQGKYIGDREFLLECARKVGVEGAAAFLEDLNNGLQEVNEEVKKYSANVTGVPHYVINGKVQLSGGQPPNIFLRAFQAVASSSA
ncbi:uncharacterized protein LOC127810059 isoform X1 [Diospyros lotus]|uniref:uncharacterized protein LOC127810059 isoform X1 n=2 Tax=Diospyros lotus TaxID=55363 RepID=UPI0022550039|nr:uncharacterized protein LOC127810059 isoform X1 [Diospyros lotus]